MNSRTVAKGERKKGYENAQRKLLHQNVAHKPFSFLSVSRPSPTISDESEFPSLNEISEKVPSCSQSGEEISKYSDKLKLRTSVQNQNVVSSYNHFKNEPVIADSYKEITHSTSAPQFTNKWFHSGVKGKFNENRAFQTNKHNETDKSDFVNKKIASVNSSQNTITKAQSNISFRESHCSNYNENKHQSPKHKPLVNTLVSQSSLNTSAINANCSSLPSKLNNQSHSKKEPKVVSGNSPPKEGNDASGNSTAKKKKKRKSKIKRQVALQTGKITVLTAEVHSKILNQTSALTSKNYRSVLTDINDEEEYPELGKSLVPASQKENFPKRESNTSESVHEAKDKNTDASVHKQPLLDKDVPKKDSLVVSIPKPEDKLVPEKKGKNENTTNKVVHPSDPITVSFYDILVNKTVKTKVKDFKVEADAPLNIALTKLKIKKNSSHPHNLLDSSSPAIKRGKEREKPKPKKPSHLKKIILLDRKARREQLLQLKGNSFEGDNSTLGNESEEEANELERNKINSTETNILSENNCITSSSSMNIFHLEVRDEGGLLLPLDGGNVSVPNDFNPTLEDKSISVVNEAQISEVASNILSSITIPAEEEKHFTEDVLDTHLDKVSINEKNDSAKSEVTTDSPLITELPVHSSKSSDSLLNRLVNHEKKLDSSDKEKAVKILLHTRNFREYCNHLISKDIDDVVFALLDDLARFQDRLHQKDPVKARMKRRMIYGVKEVKKHIKLKKLKSIIVAADIENVEAQGGLNDFLSDIKVSAADHRIPCVFALSRKLLGKVCHKPVSVSCVGVFNYEGSEANFKKMVELQAQSKEDYGEIFSKLSESLTDDQVASLLKAKKEAPEALRAIRRSILGDFFLEPKTSAVKHEKTDITSEKESNSSDTET